MDANFITASASSAQAFKTATLLKTLNVNSLITGEDGVGKRTLARYILPDAPMIDASEHQELINIFKSSNALIISNLQNSPSIKNIMDIIGTKKDIKIVATAKKGFYNKDSEKFFSIKFEIPPLRERPEDVRELVYKFAKEASELLSTKENFKVEGFKPDLSRNSDSLKRQVMISSLLEDIGEKELMDIVQNYLSVQLGSNDDYKKFLHLYEVPLIKAGLQRFKSQLQLAERLGLNRNTLRKKIEQNSKYL